MPHHLAPLVIGHALPSGQRDAIQRRSEVFQLEVAVASFTFAKDQVIAFGFDQNTIR